MGRVYCYKKVNGESELNEILERINRSGCILLSVSQHKHRYTVFFYRTVFAESSPEWTPVKNGVPREETFAYYKKFGSFPEYIVMIEGAIAPTLLFYDGNDWFDGSNNYYTVTHWMPLPQPLKGE